MIIGEVEAFPIRRADDIIWGADYRTLDGPHMGERVPTSNGLEYFNNRIRADYLGLFIDRFPMIDCVDKELSRVCS